MAIEKKSLGENLAPILSEIEDTILDSHQYNTKPNYPDEALKYAASIFLSVIMDKMYDKQCKDAIEFDLKCNQATECGNEIRQLVLKYTGIDTFDLFKHE